jgi:hypothetical protein
VWAEENSQSMVGHRLHWGLERTVLVGIGEFGLTVACSPTWHPWNSRKGFQNGLNKECHQGASLAMAAKFFTDPLGTWAFGIRHAVQFNILRLATINLQITKFISKQNAESAKSAI